MRTLLLSLMIIGIVAPAAQAELIEIDSLTCHMLPGECIPKGGKFYRDWTPAHQAQADKDKAQYEQSNAMWADYTARGGNPTIGNLELWDTANNKPLPGTAALFKKYGLTGNCGGDGQELRITDCYAGRHAREIHKKFAYIKDPVERMDVGLADRFAFDTWLLTQPAYLCGTRNGVCSSCKVHINNTKQPVSCEEGFPKQAETMKRYAPEFYQAWKNPMGTAVGNTAGTSAGSTTGTAAKIEPATGGFRPLKPVSSGSTKKKTEEEPPAFVIGGKYTD